MLRAFSNKFAIFLGLKGEASSKITYIFNWPVQISIFSANFLLFTSLKLSLKSEV